MHPHGIMFHHFYGDGHCAGQGAISSNQLAEMIEYLGPNRILSASDWLERAINGTLDKKHLCLTFDDALLCQYDIALPVLKDYSITAFWFVYSSVVSGNIEMLEVYRKFRTVMFVDIEEFYNELFRIIDSSKYSTLVNSALKEFAPEKYLVEFPFYTNSDRKFRYIRDKILGQYRYDQVMSLMLRDYQIDIEKFASDLWMREHHLRELNRENNIIGLHSHSHPTNLGELSETQQKKEYRNNFRILSDILTEPPTTMSHPNNSYNAITLSILRKLGIHLGFNANMAKPILSELEYPREDHTNIIKEMESENISFYE